VIYAKPGWFEQKKMQAIRAFLHW